MIKLVSCSGGKDSTATLLCAMEDDPATTMAAFADTGNEHEATYRYIDYLEAATGIKIERLKADFTREWWRKRDYIRDHWSDKGVPDNIITTALQLFNFGPTGVPFLDLCIIKGRFPSRTAQFCTAELKVNPLTSYALDILDKCGTLESWVGVRADESLNRAKLPDREDKGGGYSIYRPILHWNVEQVFAMHKKHGIMPNPLYKNGMGRVGCMPCINCRKGEFREIALRFPDHIDKIAGWEMIVGLGAKQQSTTFITASGENETAYERGNIRKIVEWSMTKRGGKELDDIPPVVGCTSAYGLCE